MPFCNITYVALRVRSGLKYNIFVQSLRLKSHLKLASFKKEQLPYGNGPAVLAHVMNEALPSKN